MFQKGDLIVYGNMGVCRVEAVEAPAGLPGAGEKKLYYKLDPVYETGTVYIPVDAKVFMRPILTHAQAEALIGRIPEIEENPCGGKDQQMLAEHYRSLMRTHDCDDLVQLIKTIYGKNRERTAQGKKPARTEAEYMKRAEELLHGELAAALGITPEQVPGYIAAEALKPERKKLRGARERKRPAPRSFLQRESPRVVSTGAFRGISLGVRRNHVQEPGLRLPCPCDCIIEKNCVRFVKPL